MATRSTRLRFDALPERPRRPHRFFDCASRALVVRSAVYGKIRIHLREHGSGPPLLLVHGLMTSSYSWRYVTHELGEHFRVYAPDLPGSGWSDKPPGPYDAVSLAIFLDELIDALGIRGACAIGNSLGGYLCMRLALSTPGALSRLVNMHSPGLPEARLVALSAMLAAPGAQRLLGWWVRRSPERFVHQNVHYHDETLKSLEEAREYGAALATSDGARAFVGWLSNTLRPRDLRRFSRELAARRKKGLKFPIPLLLLYSRQDRMVPAVMGERLHTLVPDAELVFIDQSSHFAHVDTPEAVLEIVLRFLRDKERSTGAALEP